MSTDTALAMLAEETIWSGCAAYAADPQVEVGNRWYLTGCRYQGLNGVFPTAVGDGAVDVSAALAPFRRRGVPMLWHLGPRAPYRLVSRLRAAGCVYDHREPLMVADLARGCPPRPAPVPGLSIVVADTRVWLTEFARIWSGCAEDPELDRLVRLRRSAGSAFGHLVGLLEGVPVACAAMFHGYGAGEVQHVVTLRWARRRGIGTSMTWRALDLLRDRGARTGVLTASPYGIRIYERLGFRRVGAVRRYRWRPPR